MPRSPSVPRVTNHPGEILSEEFLVPFGLSANALALDLHVPANRISAIANGTRAVTADTAMRLGRYFGTTPGFWLNLQAAHDLSVARAENGQRVEIEVRPREMT